MAEKLQERLHKMEKLHNILKDTDRNLTICEQILTSYILGQSQEKQNEMLRHKEIEVKMTEILETLKTRLLVD